MAIDLKNLFKEITQKDVRSFSFLEGGISNSNYLVNDAYVLRVPKNYKEKATNYAHEKNNYEVIAPLKISEKLLYMDEINGFKITKYIHNAHTYSQINEEVMNSVAKMLKKLHTSNIKVPYGYQMFKRLENYKEAIDKKYYISDVYEDSVIKNVQKIFPKEKLTFCHNDLVKGNLLFRFNTSFIIDWETGGMNNPLFDLASFISENNLTASQEEYFLKKYFGYKYNALKKKRVDTFIAFLDLLFYYWAMSYFFTLKEEVFLDIAKLKLERIKANFK